MLSVAGASVLRMPAAAQAVPLPPVCSNVSITTLEDTPGSVAPDCTGADNTYSIVEDAVHGTAFVQSGILHFTPAADFHGTDYFKYKAQNSLGWSIARANISVTSQNDAPVGGFDAYNVPAGTALTVNEPGLLANDIDADTDALTAIAADPPTHGVLQLDPNGSFTYTPDAGFDGPDTFTYKPNDGTIDGEVVPVRLSVGSEYQVPLAVPDEFSVTEDTPLQQAVPGVISNDEHPDSPDLTAAVDLQPRHGSVVLDPDGSFHYTPDANYDGTDVFGYHLDDGGGNSGLAIVTLAVDSVNDAPIATDDSYTVREGHVLSVAAPGVLRNDADPEHDALTAALVLQPSHGTATMQPDGAFTYTPDAGFTGTDTFPYRVSDGHLHVDGLVTLVVSTAQEANQAPTAIAETAHTSEAKPVKIDVLANDTDPDSDALTVNSAVGPLHGSVVVNADQTVTYTPDAGFTGDDSFTYTVTDGFATDTVTDTVSVLVNSAPSATSDTATTLEDTAKDLAVIGNDNDPDGDLLTPTIVDGPAHGEASVKPDGTIHYVPASNYNGSDTLTYTASDGTLSSSLATVNITVSSVNDAPVGAPDAYTTTDDAQLVQGAPGVLGNDADVEDDALTATLESDVSHGALQLFVDGSFTYTPESDFHGTDSFSYRANDGTTDSAPILVSLLVDAVPVANPDSATTAEDTAVTIDVLTNDTDADGDALTSALASAPSHGDLVHNADGTFTYTPLPNYNGPDSFTYNASDGTADDVIGTVTMTIDAVNDTTIALDDSYGTLEDTPITIDAPGVLGNDIDPDGDGISAIVVGSPAHGALGLNGDGSFSYTPSENYNGSDTFTYRANDGTTQSNLATVTITIDPVNDAPVALSDAYATDEDGTISIATPGVLGNDFDVDGDTMSVGLEGVPAHGSLTLNSNGSFDYIPAANYNGTDSFTYRVTDGVALSGFATVTLTIDAVNDAPVGVGDTATTDEDTPVTVAVLSNDSDVDGDIITPAIIGTPAHGSVTINADDTIAYAPAPNYHGTDSFTYKLSDGTAESAVTTVNLTVVSVNDVPVPGSDSYVTDEDTSLQIDAPGVLANDSDADLDTLSAAIAGAPVHGSLTVNSDGSFSYVPAANYNGPDSFTYVVSDGTVDDVIGTVNLTVNAVNDAPIAVADSATTDEDTPVEIPVLSNDADVDGQEFTSSLATGPTHGVADHNSDGSFTYTPAANYHGDDSFTYTVSDGIAESAVTTVTITVAPVNDAPLATNDSVATAEDTPLDILVLTNDTDTDGDVLSSSLVSGASHGTLVHHDDGSFTYTPDANYNGTDSFTYAISDGIASSNVASVDLTITAVNDAPVATGDSYSTAEETTLDVSAPGILSNDVDVEADPLQVEIGSGPIHGALTLNEDGSFTYTPEADFSGSDSFTYTVSDGTLLSNLATVDLTITRANDPPVAAGDAFTTAEDTATTLGVLANDSDVDGDALTPTAVDVPTHGTLTANPDKTFTYTPATDYNGTDSFTYAISDGIASSNVATVDLTITAVNDAPVAAGDALTTAEDTATTFGVLANDSDVEGDALTPTVVDAPTHGTLIANPDNTFTFTPAADYNGSDSFTYTVSDGALASDLATVDLTITAVNDAPVATGDSYSTAEETTLDVSAPGVLGNDTDIESDVLQTALETGPAHGALTLNDNGSFSYTPAANYNGSDSFTYKVSDGTLLSNLATVDLTITAVNDAPVATGDSYSTAEDTTLDVSAPGILSNDVDIEADPLQVEIGSGPAHGSLTLNADGSFSYAPAANYHGPDSFTYTVSDGALASNLATVDLTITAVNDAPVATGDSYTTAEDTALNVSAPGVLSNDVDVEADPVHVEIGSGPAHGSLTLNSNGSFSYTPAADYNGSDSFTYKAADVSLSSNLATVTLTVTAVNDAPTSTTDAYSTAEDTTLLVGAPGVLANDSDLESDALHAALGAGPAHGALTLNADGSFSYAPDANYNGPDSFTYQAADASLGSALASVNLTITPVNDAPTAAADAFTTAEDTALNVGAPGVLGNDTDLESDALHTVLGTGPAHGSLTVNPDGSFSYIPATNYNGSDSFTYKAADATVSSALASVSLTITAVNDAPTATTDAYSTAEDTTLNVSAPGVLGNDTDVESDALTAVLGTGPAHGSMTLNANGSFSYTPATNYNGSDSFTYQAADPNLSSALATVNLTITSVNDAPVAANDTATTAEDTSTTISVLSNDVDAESDALHTVLAGAPAHGTVTLNPDNTITYTPATNYTGSDSFTYKAADAALNSGPATVSVIITAVNDAPAATADAYTTPEDTALNVGAPGVLGNDADIESDVLHTVVGNAPIHGSLTLNADGSFSYTPVANYNGSDSFTYQAADASLSSAPTTVSITITPVNDAPVSKGETYTASPDQQLIVPAPGVLTNEIDVDGDVLVAKAGTTVPTHGTATLNDDGSFTYTPNAGYSGADSFNYRVYDGKLYSLYVKATINVTVPNRAPVAQADSYTLNEDATKTVAAAGVLSNDTDPDGNAMTAVLVTGAAHGSLSLSSNGGFTYMPSANYNGSDSFTYKASDGTLTSNAVTVTFSIAAINDAPISNADSYTTAEDSTLTVAAPGILSNDIDVDGDPLTAVKITSTAHGTLTFNSNGGFTYKPTANYNGPDSFTYKAKDGVVQSTTAGTVSFNVTPVNDTPIAAADSYTTAEDTTLNVGAPGLLANDTDVDGDTLHPVLGTGPTHGSVSLNADGSFAYTPAANYNGADSFVYRAADASVNSGPVTVSLTISAVNDAPSAQNDGATTLEDTPTTITVLVNDTDVEGDPMSSVLESVPAHGTAVVNANGTITYTPASNFNGIDLFSYRAADASLQSSPAMVSISVTPVNDAPVGLTDGYATNEDATLNIVAPGVLGNDSDVESDVLQAILGTGPSHGSFTLSSDGSFTYTPSVNYNGADSFTYKAADATLQSTLVTVSLTVNPVDDAPIATDDAATTAEDTAGVFAILSNDSDVDADTLSVSVGDGPTHGSVTTNPDGTVTYTPNANYNGSDSFTYRASDGTLPSNLGTVTVTITAVDDAPVAANDTATTSEDSPITIAVLGNDSDLEGDALVPVVVGAPAHGTTAVNTDGTVTYTPGAHYAGSDDFTYKASDGSLLSDLATVSVTITPRNDPPIAIADSYTVPEDEILNATPGILANDSDVDGDALHAVLDSGVAHGSLTVSSDGTFAYTPALNYNGADSFTYHANDGSLSSAVTTVAINVTPVNDAPVAASDSASTAEDVPVNVTVLANDSDIDGDALTAVVAGAPSHGSSTANPDGTITYSPAANYNGADSFTYRAFDGGLNSAPVTVTLTITSVNDAPVSANDSAATPEDAPVDVSVLTNDSDVDGDTLSVNALGSITGGTASLLPDGRTVRFTPAANANGASGFGFTYRASDGTLDSIASTVTITVVPVNDAPVAAADSYTANRDAQLNVAAPGVLQNDSDVDLDVLHASAIAAPTHGTLTLNDNGSFGYLPASGYTGPDAFTYRVSDGQLTSGTVTVSLTVVIANRAPVASADSYSMQEDKTLTVTAPGVLGNDSDPDGTTPSAVLASAPSHGSVTLNADGSLTYTPVANYNGADTFTYSASDGSLLSSAATVSLTITPVADAPVAVADSYSTNEDKPITASAPGVLANDYDPDGEAITGIRVTGVSHGTLTFASDGSFTYHPTANYNGPDSFTYKASDPGALKSAVVTVSITVVSVNDTPTVGADSYSTAEDTSLTVDAPGVLSNDGDVDGDVLHSVMTKAPTHGSLSLNDSGAFTYTPSLNYNGTDSFQYKANDGIATSATATVSLTITAVNDAPTTVSDVATTPEDTAVDISVLTNDTDIEGTALTTASVTDGIGGAAQILGDNKKVRFTPAANFNGAATLTYRASDGVALSVPTTVTITVTPVNDAPVIAADSFGTLEDQLLSASAPGVFANDSDVDGDVLHASLGAGPSHGALTLNDDGSFAYTPNSNYNGPDAFTYRGSDGTVTSGLVTVALTVAAVDDAPVGLSDTYFVAEDASLSVGAPAVLSNDSDVEGDALSAVVNTAPSHGSLSLNSDGSFTYAPQVNYSGGDSFTYRPDDGVKSGTPTTVAITVTPVNDAPVAANDSVTIPEDTPSDIPVLVNDTDVDADPLIIATVSAVSGGSALISADKKTVRFTPAANQNGNGGFGFTYTVSDGVLTSGIATVTIVVTPVNDAPTAVDDSATTVEETPVDVDVLANDFDVEGDAISLGAITALRGTALVLPDGHTVRFTPDKDAFGATGIGFTYRATDGSSISAPATVTVNVTPVNDPPTAVADAFDADKNHVDNFSAPGVLANDVDPDGDALTASVVASTSHGTLTLNGDGAFVYTPQTNYVGPDSFTYKITDGTLTSSTVTVSLNVIAMNHRPIAGNDSYSVNEDKTLTVNYPGVIGNDSDEDGPRPTAVLETSPAHGALTLNSNGTFTYVPAANYNGPDAFTYRASDGTLQSLPATVSITVNSVNDPPIAQSESFTTNEDVSLTIADPGVLVNDSDVDGDPLTAVKITSPAHGTVTLNAAGGFVYKPTANYNGTDSFTYKAKDGVAQAAVAATVSITIVALNDTPVAVADSFSTPEDAPFSVAAPGVLGNDVDVDGDVITAVLAKSPMHGSLTFNANGAFSYSPALNYNGVDTFTYKVTDGTVTTGSITATLNVTPVNDPPFALTENYTTAEDTALTVAAPGVLGNDFDVDGDPISPVIVTAPQHGSIVMNADGSFTFTPATNYNGDDSFAYSAKDASTSSAPVNVALSITPVNDVPVSGNDSYSMLEDGTLTVSGAGVLSNDTDVEGTSLTTFLDNDPIHGVVQFHADGSFVYIPAPDFNGTDTFSYVATDGFLVGDPATVTVGVTPVNDLPVGANDSYLVAPGQTLSVSTPGILTNDRDVDNDPITAVLVTSTAHGTLSLQSTGSFTFTPANGFSGQDKFTYRPNDGTGSGVITSVFISVNGSNSAPSAIAQTLTVDEDTALPLVLNGSDPNGDPLTFAILAAPTHGSLSGAAPNVTYTPFADYNGPDNFTFTANDGFADSAAATISLTVNAVNDAPVADPQSVSLLEDEDITILLTGSDTEGDALTYAIWTPPTNGTVTRVGPDRFSYDPNPNYFGSDSFTVKANDGIARSAVTTISVDVTSVNDRPMADGITTTVAEDGSVPLHLSGLDIEGDPLAFAVGVAPQHGTISGTPPDLTYTPSPNFNGTDSFTYVSYDGVLNSLPGHIDIVVTPVNDAPTGTSPDVITYATQSAAVTLSGADPDGDALTYAVTAQPAHGALTGSPPTLTYAPAPDYAGPDSFTFTVTDGSLESAEIPVSVTVLEAHTPRGYAQSVTTKEDMPLNVTLTGTDPDGGPLTFQVTTPPSHGSTSGTGATVLYTPAVDYNGVDSFRYTVSDGVHSSPEATITITITPVKDLRPTALRQIGFSGHAELYGWGAATMNDGSVLIGDYWNWRIVHYAKNGTYLGDFVNNPGFQDDQTQSPYGITVDRHTGDVYVADTDRFKIDKYDSAGNFLLSFGTNGAGQPGKFLYPSRTAIASDGTVYVVDTWDNVVSMHRPDGTEIGSFGSFGSGNGQFKQPHGAAFDPLDRLWVVDTKNWRVQVFDKQGHFLFKFGSKGSLPGQFQGDLRGLAIDWVHGWVYVVDAEGNKIDKFDLNGNFILRWGEEGHGPGQFSDGGREITVDGDGNVWVGDMPNFRAQKFSPTGQFLFQIPSTPHPPPLGGLNGPRGVALDPFGNIFVSDTYNQRIQKYAPDGRPLEAWGQRGRDEFEFNYPRLLAVDPRNGDVVMADTDNHRIKKYDNDGAFKWDVGGQGAHLGEFKNPHGVDVGADGKIFVADSWNARVQVLDENGNPLYVFGTLGKNPGQFQFPRGIGVDPVDGTLWVSDSVRSMVMHFKQDGTYLGKVGVKGTNPNQLDSPFDVEVDDQYVFVADSPANMIKVWTKTGAFVTSIGSGGTTLGKFQQPQGMDLSPDGKQLYIAEQKNDRITVFNLYE